MRTFRALLIGLLITLPALGTYGQQTGESAGLRGTKSGSSQSLCEPLLESSCIQLHQFRLELEAGERE